MTPNYRIGCKRVLFTNDYLPAVQRENVSLVASGVVRVEGNTVVAADGTRSEVDAIVYVLREAQRDLLTREPWDERAFARDRLEAFLRRIRVH